MRRKIISIDPAPSKSSTFCDGGGSFLEVEASNVVNKVAQLIKENGNNVLLAWDAPLTGPANTEEPGAQKGDFSQRRIDQFFSRQGTGFKTPPGISVLPYGGCPHWAITKAALGLPLLGGPCEKPDCLPFKLLDSTTADLTDGPCIVETHPAVAIWLWCVYGRGVSGKWVPKDWHYKHEQASLAAVINRLFDVWRGYDLPWLNTLVDGGGTKQGETESRGVLPENDDQLDALVGYVLARMFVEHRNKNWVILLGTKSTGSLLLPNLNGIQKGFCKFSLKENRNRCCAG